MAMHCSICTLALLLAAGGVSSWGAPAANTSAPGAAAAATPTAKLTDLFGDNLVAKGKGVEVKRSALDEAMISIKSAAALRGQSIASQDLTLIEQQVLDRLVQIQLLLAKATDADRAAGRESTAKRLETIKARARDEVSLNRQLKSMGTTLEQLRTKMTEEATAETVLERELKITVSENEVKQFYDDNPAKFEQPEMVRASHILFTTKDSVTRQDLPEDKKAAKRKQAEGALKRARAGEDFAQLAKELSEDPGSKDNGGEYTFPRGQMVAEFEAAAFSLNTNQLSDIVTTQFGYHIIKLTEKIPAKKLEFAKVSADIRDHLKQQQVQKRQQEYLDYISQLKKDAGLTILDERLRPKEPDTAKAPAGQPPVKPDAKLDKK